jgi:hypothetical protein
MKTARQFRELSAWHYKRRFVDEVLAVELFKDESEAVRSSVAVLLSVLVLGANVKRIARFLRLPIDGVRLRLQRLRENSIVRGNRVHSNWADDEDGLLELLCDALVAEGFLSKGYE